MVIYLSLLVAVIGAFMYALCTNPKLSMLGVIAYGAGALAFLLRVSGAPFDVIK